ncbi:MAG: hypothetical protein FJX73_11855 [Armatimonadetes bacterium]|nr:hypothetical protein [Armatimonadota bacterium]
MTSRVKVLPAGSRENLTKYEQSGITGLPLGISRFTLPGHRPPTHAGGSGAAGDLAKKSVSLTRRVVHRASSANLSRATRAFC